MLEPPRAKLGEGAGQVFRPRRKAITGSQHEAATPASLDLELVGLRYEGGLRWRIFFFDVDLGTVEIASLNGVVSTAGVSSVNRDELGGSAGVNPQEGADEGAAVSA